MSENVDCQTLDLRYEGASPAGQRPRSSLLASIARRGIEAHQDLEPQKEYDHHKNADLQEDRIPSEQEDAPQRVLRRPNQAHRHQAEDGRRSAAPAGSLSRA